MSPIKFDENIKKELEKRTIPMSDGAWEKLSQRLEPESKKRRIPFWWMGIAASLILVLWLSKSLMSNSKEIVPIIVDTPEKVESPLEILNDEKEIEQVAVAVKAEQKTVKEEGLTEVIPIKKKTQLNEDLIIKNTEEFIVENNKTEIIELDFKSFEDMKVLEVVAQISEIKKKNKIVTDAEIEQLLRKAQDEITIQKLFDENTKTVNADLLLYQVESEINKSFRDKVFKELKIQFNSVKNAVAQRNDY